MIVMYVLKCLFMGFGLQKYVIPAVHCIFMYITILMLWISSRFFYTFLITFFILLLIEFYLFILE